MLGASQKIILPISSKRMVAPCSALSVSTEQISLEKTVSLTAGVWTESRWGGWSWPSQIYIYWYFWKYIIYQFIYIYSFPFPISLLDTAIWGLSMLIIIKISFVSFFSFLVAGQGEIYVLGRSPGINRTRENIMYYIIYISINIIYILHTLWMCMLILNPTTIFDLFR